MRVLIIGNLAGQLSAATKIAFDKGAKVLVGGHRREGEGYYFEPTVLVDVDHSTLGNITLPGPPLRFFDPDGTEVTETRHTAPPVLGEDTDEIMSWLQGFTR
mgnify:CR=1 FL=1